MFTEYIQITVLENGLDVWGSLLGVRVAALAETRGATRIELRRKDFVITAAAIVAGLC